jgi:hypothetical protein
MSQFFLNTGGESGGGNVKSLSDDVGTKVLPDASGNIQIEGQLNEQVGFFATTVANPATNEIYTNPMSGSRWIVDPLSTTSNPNGTHNNLTSALASAFPGDTIVLLGGTYTGTFTMPPSVHLSGAGNQVVNFVGATFIFSSSTLTYLSNLNLDNGTNILIEGTTPVQVILTECNIVANSGTFLNFTNSSNNSLVEFLRCSGDISGSSTILFNIAGASAFSYLFFSSSTFTNGNNANNPSLGISTANSGNIYISNSTLPTAVTTSGTASMIVSNSDISAESSLNQTNQTWYNIGGVGNVPNLFSNCFFASGTGTCININSSANITNCTFGSANASVIGGTGTVTISGISFFGTSAGVTTTNKIIFPMNATNVGTVGQVLTSNGNTSLPSFQNATVPSGNLVLLQTQTVSSASSIAFTTGITSTYTNYVLLFYDVILSVSQATMSMQFSTNGGSSYLTSGYQSGITFLPFDSATASFGQSDSTSMFFLVIAGPDASSTMAGTINIYDLTNGATPKIIGDTISTDTGNCYWQKTFGTQATATINAIKIFPSSGNITSGTFSLYGLVK